MFDFSTVSTCVSRSAGISQTGNRKDAEKQGTRANFRPATEEGIKAFAAASFKTLDLL